MIVERCVLCSKVHILVNMEHSGTMILKAQIKIVPVRTPPNQVCDLLLPVKPRLPQTLYPTEKKLPHRKNIVHQCIKLFVRSGSS